MPVTITIPFSKLDGTLARAWLNNNDPEGSDIWNEPSSKQDLVDAVADNLRQFGIKDQSGCVIITSNREQFRLADENIHNNY